MRILVLSNCVWNYYQRINALVGQLAKRGVEIVFIEPIVYSGADSQHLIAPHDLPVPPGVKIVSRRSKATRGPFLAILQNLVNARQAFRWKADAVILCDPTFCILPALLLYPSRTRVVFDYVDDWPEWSQVPWEKWMLKHVLIPLTARLANVCTVTAELLGKDIEPHARRVVWNPNGAEDMPLPLDQLDAGGGEGILFVGRLGERIDVVWIIEMARELPEIPVTILGGGPRYAEVQEAARQVPNLHAPGPVSHAEAIAAMKSAAIGLVPYIPSRLTDRCFPVKLAEYWSMAKPVIATSSHEIRRVGESVVQFADTGREAAAVVRRLLENREERERLGRAGHQKACEFNYEVLADRFLNEIMR